MIGECISMPIFTQMADIFNIYTVSKNSQNYFCHNFVKFPPTLIIFDTKMAKTIELCKVHSFTISPNLCQRTTVWNKCSKLLHYAVVICIGLLTFASSMGLQTARASNDTVSTQLSNSVIRFRYQLRYLSPGSGESCCSFSETAHLGVQENLRAASGNCCGHSVKWLRSRSKNHNISVTSEIMFKHRKQH